VSGWNYHDARTTLAMAAWVDGSLWLVVEECPAWRAWPALAPWREGMGGEVLGKRLRLWVQC
jgi:hypothetical protein